MPRAFPLKSHKVSEITHNFSLTCACQCIRFHRQGSQANAACPNHLSNLAAVFQGNETQKHKSVMLWPVVYLTCKQSVVNLLVRGAALPRPNVAVAERNHIRTPMSCDFRAEETRLLFAVWSSEPQPCHCGGGLQGSTGA